MPQGIHGVVLLDKPEGISSQTAVTIVKRAFDAEKAGHTGTLDPMAFSSINDWFTYFE